MKVTRHSVFETNSSSCHTITVDDNDFIPDKLDVVDGVCKIFPGEFGWEVEKYNDAQTKASYCLTYAKTASGGDSDLSLVDQLRDVIAAETGAKVKFVQNAHDSYAPWGYIDHQSMRVAAPAFASDSTLRAFIFNPASTLETDNDNH